MKTIGIYQIKNNKNGKLYIGSSIHIEFRFNKHKSLLRQGNSKSSKLQKDWDAYGEESFEFSILEIFDVIEENELLKKEDEYIILYSSNQEAYGYNTYSARHLKGEYSHSEETRKKIAQIQTGRKLSEKHKANISKGLIGKISHSDDIRNQIGLKNKRKHYSEKVENEIKECLINGEKARDLSKKFNLGEQCIGRMKKQLEEQGVLKSKAQVKREAIILIQENILSTKEIAEKLNVTPTTILNYKRELK